MSRFHACGGFGGVWRGAGGVSAAMAADRRRGQRCRRRRERRGVGRGHRPVEGGYRIWRRDGATWKATQAAGVRIAVGPNGEHGSSTTRRDFPRQCRRRPCDPVPGEKRATSASARTAPSGIGDNAEAGGYGIYRLRGRAVEQDPGLGLRISVDPSGNAWVVNNTAKIFRHDGSRSSSCRAPRTTSASAPTARPGRSAPKRHLSLREARTGRKRRAAPRRSRPAPTAPCGR